MSGYLNLWYIRKQKASIYHPLKCLPKRNRIKDPQHNHNTYPEHKINSSRVSVNNRNPRHKVTKTRGKICRIFIFTENIQRNDEVTHNSRHRGDVIV